MRIAICDDSAEDVETVRRFLMEHFKNNGFAGEINTFSSGEALLSAFKPGKFDAVFLDVFMGGMTGVKTAEKMRLTDPNFALVFITSSDRYAVNAFTLRANGYVTKPIERDSLDAAFSQCRSVFMKNARFIEAAIDRQSIRIPITKILYIEVYGHEVLIHSQYGVINTSTPLSKIETDIGRPFLRCNRSYLVNMNHVSEIGEHSIIMSNGVSVPISNRSRNEVREAYADFISDRLFEVV